MTYIYLMKNQKPLNLNVIQSHVEFLKELDNQGKLVVCGPFTDYPGGMVVFHADDLEEAIGIIKSDPFIELGYKSFELRTLELCNKENNYML